MSRVPLTLVALALVVACGDAGDPPPHNDAPVSEPAGAAPRAAPVPAPPPVPVSRREPLPLTERDVTAYVAVLEDLDRAGERLQAEVMADTNGVVLNEGLLAASPSAQRAIARRGFRDLEHFHQTAYSIASAMQAAEAVPAPEAMPLPADPEERKALEEVRKAMGEFAAAQPAGNAELVARYRDRIVRAQAGN